MPRAPPGETLYKCQNDPRRIIPILISTLKIHTFVTFVIKKSKIATSIDCFAREETDYRFEIIV